MYVASYVPLNNILISLPTASYFSLVLKMSEERREAEEERKRILANIEEHKLLESEQQAEMKRVKFRELYQ